MRFIWAVRSDSSATMGRSRAAQGRSTGSGTACKWPLTIRPTHPSNSPPMLGIWPQSHRPAGGGYRPVRYQRMTRSLDDPLPDTHARWLGDASRRPKHYRLIWDAGNEAFRDHWGYSPVSERIISGWRTRRSSHQSVADRQDVATDGSPGRCAFIDALEASSTTGSAATESIGVRRLSAARLAERSSPRACRAKGQGMTESALTVDSKQWATRLYERAVSRQRSGRSLPQPWQQ
jgi:hypothetical protein